MSGDLDVLAQGALPAEAPSDDSAQDQASDDGQGRAAAAAEYEGFSEEELGTLIDQRVARIEQRLDALFRGMQGLTDRNLAATQKEIASVRAEMGLLRKFAEQNLDPDTLAEFERQQREASFQERERELRAAEDALRQRVVEQAPAPDASRQAQADYFNDVVLPDLEDYAKEQGVDLLTLSNAGRLPSQLRPTARDKTGWRTYIKQVRDLIDEESARIEKAAKPRARIDTTVPGVAGTPNTQELIKRSARGEHMTTAELAQLREALGRL